MFDFRRCFHSDKAHTVNAAVDKPKKSLPSKMMNFGAVFSFDELVSELFLLSSFC